MDTKITRFDGGRNLSEEVRTLVREAVSENTRRAYRTDLEHFMAWGGSIPCRPDAVALYLAEHAQVLAVSTLKRRLAAISVAHDAKGYPSPTSSKLVKAAMRGIQRVRGSQQRQAKALLVEDLMKIMAMLGDDPKDIRDKALLLIGFAGGFRRSELVAINCTDVKLVRQGMTINIRRSKTDQLGHGRKVGIPFARGRYCPVRTYEAWRDVIGVSDGAVFRPVTRHGDVKAARLSGEAVSRIIKTRVAGLGYDVKDYSGHSLRAGLVTSGAMAGLSTLAIKQQTGHRSDAAVQKYVRLCELFYHNAASSLL